MNPPPPDPLPRARERGSTGHVARLGLGIGLGAIVACLGWRRGALSGDGAVAATAVGASTFGFGGLPASLALIAFFASGSVLSRRRAVAGEVPSAKGHRRDAVQVVANGGVAAVALMGSALGWRRGRAAALGALAAASADTWASEIGVRSPSPPRSIMTGELVPPGASGGVTPLGWLAAAAGATLVGGTWALADRRNASWIAIAIVAGLAGSFVDSVAGATIQAAYKCKVCGLPAEVPGLHCGRERSLVRGRSWITNDVVNGMGTAAGAVVGAVLSGARAAR